MSTCVRLQALLMLFIAVYQNTGQDAKVFRITLASNGTELCAVDSPTTDFTVSELKESSINIIGCAPPKTLCAWKCMKDEHCISYNWRDDSQLCELFQYPIESCAVVSRCTYYQTTYGTTTCRQRADTTTSESKAWTVLSTTAESITQHKASVIWPNLSTRQPTEAESTTQSKDMGDATTSSSRPTTSSSANKETASKINVTTPTKSAAIGVSPPAFGIPLPPSVCSASTLMQQKVDGSTFFQKSWIEFKMGFGDQSKNYWFGNEKLYILTNVSCSCQSRVEVCRQSSTPYYGQWGAPNQGSITCSVADYSSFSICSEADGYRLQLGTLSGTAGSGMSEQNNRMFSTVDRDNDQDSSVDCGGSFGVGWWYGTSNHVDLNVPCGNTNLNEETKYFYWSTFSPMNLVLSRVYVTCTNKAG